MRGSLRIRSLTGLVLFIGWSLLAHARESIASPAAGVGPKTTPTRSPPPAPLRPVVDPRRWN